MPTIRTCLLLLDYVLRSTGAEIKLFNSLMFYTDQVDSGLMPQAMALIKWKEMAYFHVKVTQFLIIHKRVIAF